MEAKLSTTINHLIDTFVFKSMSPSMMTSNQLQAALYELDLMWQRLTTQIITTKFESKADARDCIFNRSVAIKNILLEECQSLIIPSKDVHIGKNISLGT